MKKQCCLSFVMLIISLAVNAHCRSVFDLDFGWRFHLGQVVGGEDLDFDDSQWPLVNVPHDFQIGQPWVVPSADEKADSNDPAANIRSRLSSRGFKEMGQGWYRLHFTPSDSLRGRRLLLQFDGILYVADVYLNGQRIGGIDYGYVGFELDVTDRLRLGKENVIAVCADTREPNNSRWYTGGGLFRDVRLVATSRDTYFERYPLRITTRDNRYVSITAEVAFRGQEKSALMDIIIFDPDGKKVHEGTAVVKRSTPSRVVEQLLPEIEIPLPQLWDLEHPRLYTVRLTLRREDGREIDDATSTFGIRTVDIVAGKGLLLNGRKVLLKGCANHHTLGALGAAAYPRAIEKRIQLMKSFGVNHIRTSHNPYSRSFIELCDRYGILVVDELYDKWTQQYTGGRVPFEAIWQQHIPEWIKRDRNSPSVVMWSLGNELQQDPHQPYNDFGVTMYRLQKTLLERYDTTRLVTVAMHPRYRNWETDSLPAALAMITDVQAYNYRYMYFPGDYRRFPWMRFYQSEAAMAAMGPNFFEMNLDQVVGLAYWGAIDYLGESQGWPAKGWNQGCFDLSLEPKPKAYLMKSMFKPEEPVVHIAVIDRKGDQMWNGVQTGVDGMSDHWNRSAGQRLSLFTYTNADEVELRLNGRLIGRKANMKEPKCRNQIRWDSITYEPGVLEATAYVGGKVVARHRIETVRKAVRLVAEPDRQQFRADGQDLLHVRVMAVDGKKRQVPFATDEVTFNVEGPAEIVGVVNGDINSPELHVGCRRSLFNGTCTVILRAERTPGKVVLKATSPKLKAAVLKTICE